MTNKKMTLREYYTELLKIEAVVENETLKAMTEGRLDALDRKSASGERKPTATQVANEGLKTAIVNAMESDTDYTVSDMLKNFGCCEGLSSSKVTAMLTQLLKTDAVIRTESKGRAYYRKA